MLYSSTILTPGPHPAFPYWLQLSAMLPSHAFGNPNPGIPHSPLQNPLKGQERLFFFISTVSDLLASELIQCSWVTGSSFVLEKDF